MEEQYYVLAANNVDDSIDIEYGPAPLEKARKYMIEAAEQVVLQIVSNSCPDEGDETEEMSIEEIADANGIEYSHSDHGASILDEGSNDYYYYNIVPVPKEQEKKKIV